MMSDQAIKDSDVLDGLNVKYLKFFGLWRVVNDFRTTGKRNKILRVKIFITLVLVLPYILCQYLSYFVIKVDIQKAIFLNLHLLPGTQICCKIVVFWFKIESQCKLFDLLKKDFLSVPEEMRPEAAEIFKKITRRTNKLCLAAFIVNISIIISSIADPAISVDYILYHTGDMAAVTTGKKKMLGGWYPVPMAETPYYELIYVYEAVAGTLGGFLLAMYVCLFYQVLMCLYAQFTILCLKTSALKIKSDNGRINSSIYKELNEILKEHQKLLSYAKELRSVYNPLVTLIIGIGLFILIIAIFQFLFGGKSDFMFIFKSLQLLVYQCVEVSMFCFGSTYIETASSDLQFAIYSSDWYMTGMKFRKEAQMMMIRATKGETLTALRVYPINVETIMSILHFTYSASAVVSRMAE
ncbi:odorant receptor 49b-like [Halyomorpha halys]|uniref:odorant receptor 49b-like n=1 Tax=Halyomorpha halys TaxID=286706 RepID=UPI0006D4D331|nr:Odorant receptor 69 [Halyomorpha halys]